MKGLNTSGNWYKGNLHCHTTNSDGKLTPEETVERYKSKGWSFLALTDHQHYSHLSQLGSEDFLILPGTELAVINPNPVRIYHILGIGKEPCGENNAFGNGEYIETPEWKGICTPQEYINRIIESNNLAVFCHPNWSRLELSDFLDLSGYFALEIFNYGCEIESHTGLSIDYWDSLLRRGRKIWGVATDDAHHILEDRCGGWICVNSPSLLQKDIITSIIEGNFYASSGPEIFEFNVNGNEVYVSCSPVSAIHFVTYEHMGYSKISKEPTTEATYKLRGDEKYVRIECVDEHGNTAWSNPIFLSEVFE